MSAVLAVPAETIVEKGGAFVQEKAQELKANPAQFISNALIKWGSVIFIAGIGAWILSVACTRSAQGYLHDADNVLGIPPESPPTPPRNVPPAPQPPPPPPEPVQVTLISRIVGDINDLGTSSASANVVALQDALNQLWNLTYYVYGSSGGGPAKQEPSGQTGVQLAEAILQTCTLIYMMEGREIPNSPEWTWEWWNSTQTQVFGGFPGLPNKFLQGITTVALETYSLQGTPDWASALNMVSNTSNDGNYKITINYLAADLNTSQPFNIAAAGTGGNNFGPLGSFVTDLSGIGAAIVNLPATVGNDIEGALSAAGKDLSSTFTQIGAGIAEFAKAVENFPRLVGDGLGYAFSWAGEMIFDAVYIPMLALGGAMITAGVGIRYVSRWVWPEASHRLELHSNAFWGGLWNRFDAKYGTLAEVREVNAFAKKELAIEAANARLEAVVAPPAVEAGLPAEPERSKPQEVGGDVPPNVPTLPAEQPPEVTVTTEIAAPIPGGATTEETENYLGDHDSRAPTPDELAAQHKALMDSMPAQGPTYRQRKEEAEHERAEKLLALGDDWGEA
jgi:hypothetical protein